MYLPSLMTCAPWPTYWSTCHSRASYLPSMGSHWPLLAPVAVAVHSFPPPEDCPISMSDGSFLVGMCNRPACTASTMSSLAAFFCTTIPSFWWSLKSEHEAVTTNSQTRASLVVAGRNGHGRVIARDVLFLCPRTITASLTLLSDAPWTVPGREGVPGLDPWTGRRCLARTNES